MRFRRGSQERKDPRHGEAARTGRRGGACENAGAGRPAHGRWPRADHPPPGGLALGLDTQAALDAEERRAEGARGDFGGLPALATPQERAEVAAFEGEGGRVPAPGEEGGCDRRDCAAVGEALEAAAALGGPARRARPACRGRPAPADQPHQRRRDLVQRQDGVRAAGGGPGHGGSLARPVPLGDDLAARRLDRGRPASRRSRRRPAPPRQPSPRRPWRRKRTAGRPGGGSGGPRGRPTATGCGRR